MKRHRDMCIAHLLPEIPFWESLWRHRDHSGYGLSKWRTTLQCNAVWQWLSPYPEWSLRQHEYVWILHCDWRVQNGAAVPMNIRPMFIYDLSCRKCLGAFVWSLISKNKTCFTQKYATKKRINLTLVGAFATVILMFIDIIRDVGGSFI